MLALLYKYANHCAYRIYFSIFYTFCIGINEAQDSITNYALHAIATNSYNIAVQKPILSSIKTSKQYTLIFYTYILVTVYIGFAKNIKDYGYFISIRLNYELNYSFVCKDKINNCNPCSSSIKA